MTVYAAGPAPLSGDQAAPSYATMPVVALSLTFRPDVKPPAASALTVVLSAVSAAPARPTTVMSASGVNLAPVTVTWSPGLPEAVASWMERSLAPGWSVATTVSETGAGGLVTVQGVSSSMM